MPRLARLVVPGLPHHVTQRGTRREDVFFSDEDRVQYLMFLREAAERFGVTVWSWCLMSNHVHFVAVPEGEKSLALCFGRAHTQYTRMIDFRKGWRGPAYAACEIERLAGGSLLTGFRKLPEFPAANFWLVAKAVSDGQEFVAIIDGIMRFRVLKAETPVGSTTLSGRRDDADPGLASAGSRTRAAVR